MLRDAIELAVAVLGAGLVVLSVRQARAKGAAASLQMASGGFLLMGAAAVGIVGFVVGLVFSPLAWLGVGMLVVAGGLFALGQKLEKPTSKAGPDTVGRGSTKPKGVGQAPRQAGGTGDSELDDIEAILRRHGIE